MSNSIMTDHSNNARNDEQLLMEKLRSILLRDEREKVEQLESIVEHKEHLSVRVDPIVEEHIQKLKEEFPDHYRAIVDRMMEQKIKDSSDEILNTIYPVLGQMIKKYIAHQFQLLRESIDQQIQNTFSTQGVLGRVKARLFGLKDSDLILSEFDKPSINEIFVIQRDSGLLIAGASIKKMVDRDLVAGMLTAIKAFVEDAFDGGEQNLGMIEYDTHKIYLQNFPTYYFAVAMSGSVTSREKEELSNKILEFAEKEISNKILLNSENTYQLISEQLKTYFIAEEAQLLD